MGGIKLPLQPNSQRSSRSFGHADSPMELCSLRVLDSN